MKRRFRHTLLIASGLVALVAVSGAVVAAAGAGSSDRAPGKATAAKKKAKKYEDSELFIEIHGTDGDAGLHMDVGGDAWRRLHVTNPKNKRILDVRAKSKLGEHGLAGVMIESSEPAFDELPFARFKRRFPEGKYRFKGKTIEGRTMKGTDRLSHDVPKTPVVTSPADGGNVDPGGFVFRWEPATDKKVEIVRYQLTVSDEDHPNGEVVIEVGPGVTSATIDGEYLVPGTQYAAELIALERSGNQTILALEFKTGG